MNFYRRVDGESDCRLGLEDVELVAHLLEERHGYRVDKQWELADKIFHKLVSIGILIDDKKRTWAVGPPPRQSDIDIPPESGGVPCEMCGRCFRSRNLLFKHLRNLASTCGAALAADGAIDSPPSQAKPRRRPTTCQPSQTARHCAARHAAAEHCAWFGDIPAAWSHPRRFKQLLYAYSPPDVPQPWVKKIVRRQYKDPRSGQYLGYAIVCYRDAEEAALVRDALDGRHVLAAGVYASEQLVRGGQHQDLANDPGFQLRVRQAEHGDTAPVPVAAFQDVDPPLVEQLRPLPVVELLRRVAMLTGEDFGQKSLEPDREYTHEEALAAACSAYEVHPRPRRHAQGCALPIDLAERLLAELQQLRWPAKNQRAGLTSERYLVLLSRVTLDCYSSLRSLCSELMAWAAPEFSFSGIAVTKNFVGSPHIDERDRANQYAVSLGDFSGGELCIDSVDDDGHHQVVVVETKNRIARLDGRHVHWVRTFQGDRYSLIFYDTSDRSPQPIGPAFDAEWRPTALSTQF